MGYCSSQERSMTLPMSSSTTVFSKAAVTWERSFRSSSVR